MVGDNGRVFVVSEGEERFRGAMELLCDDYTATHYAITKEWGLVLFWTDPKTSVPVGFTEKVCALPYPMKGEAISDFAWNFLRTVDYGSEPDHDGSNGKGFAVCNGKPGKEDYKNPVKGFAVYNEEWGHVADMWEAFCAVAPVYMMYGK
jgi:hypothetical protein